MAAFIYDLARNAILNNCGVANTIWVGLSPSASNSILCGMLVCATNTGTGPGVFGTTAYQAASATDNFITLVPGYATTGTGSVLAGGVNSVVSFSTTKTGVAGALFVSGNQLVFPAVTTSTLAAGALVLWLYSGTASTSPVVAYIDYNNWNPANVIVPNGSSITFTFASSGNGIFKL
jgi:hypothetical protein